jgi:hypothetical protein
MTNPARDLVFYSEKVESKLLDNGQFCKIAIFEQLNGNWQCQFCIK